MLYNRNTKIIIVSISEWVVVIVVRDERKSEVFKSETLKRRVNIIYT